MMLEIAEINERITDLRRYMDSAAHACESEKDVHNGVKDAIDLLNQKALQMEEVLETTDETHIRQFVDLMERIGRRAESACRNDSNMQPTVRLAVAQVHSELINLQRQLH